MHVHLMLFCGCSPWRWLFFRVVRARRRAVLFFFFLPLLVFCFFLLARLVLISCSKERETKKKIRAFFSGCDRTILSAEYCHYLDWVAKFNLLFFWILSLLLFMQVVRITLSGGRDHCKSAIEQNAKPSTKVKQNKNDYYRHNHHHQLHTHTHIQMQSVKFFWLRNSRMRKEIEETTQRIGWNRKNVNGRWTAIGLSEWTDGSEGVDIRFNIHLGTEADVAINACLFLSVDRTNQLEFISSTTYWNGRRDEKVRESFNADKRE